MEDLQLVSKNLSTVAHIHRELHGQQCHDLSQVVLQDISDHSVLVIEGNTT